MGARLIAARVLECQLIGNFVIRLLIRVGSDDSDQLIDPYPIRSHENFSFILHEGENDNMSVLLLKLGKMQIL